MVHAQPCQVRFRFSFFKSCAIRALKFEVDMVPALAGTSSKSFHKRQHPNNGNSLHSVRVRGRVRVRVGWYLLDQTNWVHALGTPIRAYHGIARVDMLNDDGCISHKSKII